MENRNFILNKLLKYNKIQHRIIYYFLAGPLLALLLGCILFLILFLFDQLVNLFRKPASDFILQDYTFIIFIPIVAVSFLYAYIFFNRDLKTKITYGIILGLNYIVINGLFRYFNYNRFGMLIISLILFEVSYNIFNRRDLRLLVPLIITFMVWFIGFRTGDIPLELIKNDINRLVKERSINYKTYFSMDKYNSGYDNTINYLILTPKDTLVLEMNYQKEFEGKFVLGSQKWKLKNWKIKKVTGH